MNTLISKNSFMLNFNSALSFIIALYKLDLKLHSMEIGNRKSDIHMEYGRYGMVRLDISWIRVLYIKKT